MIEARPDLWLLTGGRGLSLLRQQIERRVVPGERVLADALRRVEGQFDFVVLDTSPGWDALTTAAMFYADDILAPVRLEPLTLSSLMGFLQNVRKVQRFHEHLQLRHVLPTFLDRRVKQSEEMLVQVRAYFGAAVCWPIRYNVSLSEAAGLGMTIFEYAPRSAGARDYELLTERVVAEGSS